MKYHVVLDTNVLVSALISKNRNAATVILFSRLLADDKIELLLDKDILSEYREVLQRPKFSLPEDLVDKILRNITSIARFVEPSTFSGILPDPKDIMFVRVSLSVPGSRIITGNMKHFPQIENVMSPADFLKVLDDNVQ